MPNCRKANRPIPLQIRHFQSRLINQKGQTVGDFAVGPKKKQGCIDCSGRDCEGFADHLGDGVCEGPMGSRSFSSEPRPAPVNFRCERFKNDHGDCDPLDPQACIGVGEYAVLG